MAAKPPSTEDRHRVDTRAPDIEADEEEHTLARALRVGVSAMKEHAKHWRFMRPNPGELEIVELGRADDRDYSYSPGDSGAVLGGEYTIFQLRVERACMPNPWKHTIQSTANLPFRSQIVLRGWDTALVGKDLGDGNRLRGWVDDLDGEGRSLDEWAAEAFQDSLYEGIAFGFVDNDSRSFPDPASRARAGGRPYCIRLLRGDITRITLEQTPRGPRVKQLVFSQPISITDVSDPDQWVDKTIPARKVVTAGEEIRDPATGRVVDFRPVSVQVYVEDEESGKFVEDEDQRTTITPENPKHRLVDVPLVPLYGKRKAPYRGESPYLDSAHTQASIWNQMSEFLNKARETALSYLHESGVDPTQGAAGTDGKPALQDTRGLRYRFTSQPTGDLKFVEQSGESLAELRRTVEWLQSMIETEHHQINSERPSAPVTAREITLEGVHASSALEMMVIFAESGWTRILELMSLLGGLPSRGTVEIPHDFGLPNSGMARNHQLMLAGKITAKNYWREALRAGDVDEKDFDLEAELELEKRDAEMSASVELAASFEEPPGRSPADASEPEEPEEQDESGVV